MDTHNAAQGRRDGIETIISAVRLQGRIWAGYGLTVGKLALETSARTLSSLASTLGSVAQSLVPSAGEPARSEASSNDAAR